MYSTGGWVSPGGNSGTLTTVTGSPNNAGGATVTSTLALQNISSSDVGSYRFITTNSANGTQIRSATSAVVTISVVTTVPNSFADNVVNGGYGAVAFWPLNETNDPSTGMAEAYEIIGGFNGVYGWNAMNGASNTLDKYAAAPGPSTVGLGGFPGYGAAYGNPNTNLFAAFVTIPTTPTFPGANSGGGPTPNSTNVSIVAWVYPSFVTAEEGSASFIITRTTYGSSRTDGFRLAGNTSDDLGYNWDNNNGTTTGYDSGLSLPLNQWSMAGLVITPGNSVFYLGNTNLGLKTATQTIANDNEPWGALATIGADPGNGFQNGTTTTYTTARTWAGYISSVAMFNGSLTASNMEALFDAGLALGNQQPFFTANPTNSYEFVKNPSGINATFAASAYGASATNGGFWQVNYGKGAGWTTLTNGAGGGTNLNAGGTAVAVVSNYTTLVNSTLTITNASSSDVGSYRMVVTNLFGNSATSTVATISFVSAPAANGFAAALLSPGYGAVAYWPLTESGDPSVGEVEAYDVIGGRNGFYGANAQVGGIANSFVQSYSNGLYLLNGGSVQGPASASMPGLPSTAFDSIQNVAALPATYVTIPTAPTFPAVDTNQTIVAWIYPNNFTQAAGTGVVLERASGSVDGINYNTSIANSLGYHWDNNNGTLNGYNTGLQPASNMWSMVALVSTSTNLVLYVANTNQGFLASTLTFSNAAQTWGGSMAIGSDTGTVPGRNFGGKMSSVAMFSNALSYAQIGTLFDAGLANSNQLPFITQNPLSSQLLTNFPVNATFTAAGYGGANNLTNGSFWQRSVTSGTWVTLADAVNGGPANIFGSCVTNTNSLNLISTLTVSNVTTADVGSYQLIISNSFDGVTTYYATSAVATLSLITTQPAPGSFAASALSAGGLVAYWPLNETGDPSTGTVEAYDIVGGYNGLYGVNAQDGGVNSVLQAAGGPNYFSPVPGPSSAYSGFPTINSALGSIQNKLANTFVTTLASPIFPTAGTAGWNTNVTIIAWINPKTNEAAFTGLVTQNANGQTNGLAYSPTAGILGYTWNGTNNYANGPAVPTNQWSMVALVVSSTNTTLYLAKTNGVLSAVNIISNANQTWGGPLSIGGDPVGGGPARSFGGYISSVAIFSNAFSSAQIESLFLAGYTEGVVPPPVIAIQPAATNLMLTPTITASITASAFGFPPINGYWQKWNGSAWAAVPNAGDISGATSTFAAGTLQQGTLVFSSLDADDQGSYQLVFTNSTFVTSGTGATSYVVNLQLTAFPQAGSFAAQITNAAYGTVAFWPLNQTGDPSTGTVTAWDVIGGFNGLYGVNAQDGGINTVLQAAGGANYLGAVAGPGAWGLAGLPSSGALASLQNVLPNTFVTTPASPALPGLNSPASVAVPNSTNLTLVEWVYPRSAEAAGTSLFFERAGQLNANRTDAMFVNSGPVLSGAWDNNAVANFAGPAIPMSNWSMVALVITPKSNIYYVGTNYAGTNVLISTTQAWTNDNEPFGGGVAIGGDPGNPNNGTNVDAVSFNGFISSAAMFTNSLTLQQVEALFVAGESNGLVPPPVMITQPALTYYELVQGASVSISAAGYGAQAGGYWQVNTGGGFVPVYTPDITGTNLTTNGTLLAGTLQITNFQPSDAGQYELVITNAAGAASSVAVTLAIYSAPAGSYAAVATSKGYGAVAFWPLNETVDPSAGTAVAYELIGGFNGYYGVNANNGGGNVVESLAPQLGPAAYGLAGFPAVGGAFGSIQNTANAAVTISNMPVFPGLNAPAPLNVAVPNSTNMTIVAWVYPTIPVEPEDAPFLVTRSGYLGANRTDAFRYNFSSADNDLSSYWDNANGTSETFDSGLTVLSNQWNMVAFVVTPGNLVFYLGNAQNGLTSSTETIVNDNEPFGFAACIGSDPGGSATGRVFNGAMSSVTMFSNSLTTVQLGSLLNAGVWDSVPQAPIISVQPPPAVEDIAGRTLVLTSVAYCGTNPANGWWEGYNGAAWTNVANAAGSISGATASVTSGLSQVASLSLVISAGTVGTYRAAFTNGVGAEVDSAACTVTLYAVPANGYAVTALSIPGIMAYWPLDETTDPSAGNAVAFDLVGGFNGLYSVNANNGGGNILAEQLGYYNGPQAGPAASGLTGFAPDGGALGSISNIPNTYVYTTKSPTFPGLNGPAGVAVPNSTNVTIVAWCNPSIFPEPGNAPFLVERAGEYGATRTASFRIWGNASGVSFNNDLGFAWDNNVAAAYAQDSALNIPVGIWSMVSLVITPTNATMFLANTNTGFQSYVLPIANQNEPWGAGVEMGSDPGSTATGRVWCGAISSVTMFSNSLTVPQLASLFAAGVAQGNLPPFVAVNPPTTNYNLLPGGSASITCQGYGGPGTAGYWQMYDSQVTQTWTNLSAGGSHPIVSGGVSAGGANAIATLVLTNVTAANIGSYQCIVTNASGISATSAVVQLQQILTTPTLNSFAYVATEPSYGMVAYWPLNDAGDVSTNMETYDVWGGWNGIYGTNAADGLYSIQNGAGTTGPGSAGFTGFAINDSSLGCSGLVSNAYVKTTGSPTMSAATNMTILAWLNPSSAAEPVNAALVFLESPFQVDGLTYGGTASAQDLGYIWNGANGALDSGVFPAVGHWFMNAMVITSTSTTWYIFDTNGVQTQQISIANPYQAWGLPIYIGGNPGTSYTPTDPALTFTGDIADVAIFNQPLTQAQLANLYFAGVASGAVAPTIYIEPNPSEVLSGRTAEFTVGYTGFGTVTNQWQYFNGSTWVNVQNGLGISGATSSTLIISNATAANAHSYRVIVGNISGTVTNNTAVSLAIEPGFGAIAYPKAVTNLNPVAYYRFSEAAESPVAFDYWGGLTGTYDGFYSGNTWEVGVNEGVVGVNNTMNSRPLDFPQAPGSFENNNTAAQFTNVLVQAGTGPYSDLIIPPLTTISNGIISNNMTVTMWIYPNELQAYTNGLFYSREGAIAGLGFVNSAGGWLGYNWANKAGTTGWTGNQNLIPAAGAWNFVALVITPTNGTVYCYNLAAQNSAVNNVTNAVQAWTGEAVIGDDPFDATGAREFDGSIDEVAIFNYALNSGQINSLWTTATGLQVPAVIQTPLSGPTNFVNLDSVMTYTVGAVNGPLFYQWLITNANTSTAVVLTNGANGYTGSLFSGATTTSLTISNLPALLTGQTLMISVTNPAVNVPAISTATLPQIFPTAAIWTADFFATNTAGPTPFTAFGAIGAGNIWNAFADAAPYINLSSSNDVGTIPNTGALIQVNATGGSGDAAVVASDFLLMDVFLPMPAPSTSGIVLNTQPGFYNLFMYSCESTWANRGLNVTIDGNVQSIVNVTGTQGGGNYGPASERYTYVLGENMAIFTNVFIPSGVLDIGTDVSQAGSTACFNGMQLQLIEPYAPLTFTNAAKTTTLYWAGGLLQASGTVNGTFTNVMVGGNNAVSPYVVPAQPSGSAIFYKSFLTNTAAPGIPYQ